MERTFNIGDVVKMKTPSPKMTIESIDGDRVYCKYYNGTKGEFVREVFHPNELVIAG